MSELNGTIYALVAVVGFIIYSYANWCASGEAWDGKKFFVSIMTGLLGVLAAVVVMKDLPLTFESIILALTPAAGASASLDALMKLKASGPSAIAAAEVRAESVEENPS